MKATLTVLGSGTSMGVPTLGCDCAVCHSTDPHDRRTRPSIMLEYGGKVVLIDTTPDFYTQAVRENITRVDAVLYTHTHADHILGIDDLRPSQLPAQAGKAAALCAARGGGVSAQACSATFLTATTNSAGCRNWNCDPIDGPVDVLGVRFDPVDC